MYHHCLIFILLCCVSFIYKDVSCQKYFGQCDDTTCGNLICVQHHHNVSTYSCFPPCQTNDSTEMDCASSLNCSSRLCSNESVCMSYVDYSVCQCPVGFSGDHCQTNVTVECPDRCSNYTDLCTNGTSENIVCHCDRNRAGTNCNVYLCTNQSTCGNHGSCHPDPDSTEGYKCVCQNGFTGQLCNEPINKCASNPCKNGATCNDRIGSFWCNCTGNWTGPVCDVSEDDTVCRINNCLMKGNNRMCDRECDDIVCNFDNTECLFGVDNPWKSCLAGDRHCMTRFKDGTCDADCNNEQCLFDGFDCLPPVNCENEQCYMTINDGVCDANCTSRACFYDGNDCHLSTPRTSIGSVILRFFSSLNITESKNTLNLLAQQISLSTRVGFFLKSSPDMRYAHEVTMRDIVYDVELLFTCGDNSAQCWTSIQSYTNILAAYLKQANNLALPSNITTITACPLGMYGEYCDMNCSRNCIAFCDAITGTCNGGCVSGYHGDMCDQRCPLGTYGSECKMNCSENCINDETCNHTTGYCDNGCRPGWKHRRCDTGCKDGTYGSGCIGVCGQCASGICSNETGECGKCLPGWIGKRCKLLAPDLQQEENRRLNLVVSVIIVIILLVIVVILVIIFCYCKQRKLRAKEKSVKPQNNKRHSSTSRRDTSPMSTASRGIELDNAKLVIDVENDHDVINLDDDTHQINSKTGSTERLIPDDNKGTEEETNLGANGTDEDLKAVVTGEDLAAKFAGEEFGAKANDGNIEANVTDEDLEARVTGKDLGSKVTDDNLGINSDVNLGEKVNDKDLGTNVTDDNLGANVINDNLGTNVTDDNLETNVTGDNLGAKAIDDNLETNVSDDNLETNVTGDNLGAHVTHDNLGGNFTRDNLGANFTDKDLGVKVTDDDLGEKASDQNIGAKVNDEEMGAKVTDDLGPNVTDENLGAKVNDGDLGSPDKDNIHNKVLSDDKDGIEAAKADDKEENLADTTGNKPLI